MGRLDGRVVIVTGAAHRERAALGATFAKTLAAEGAQVVAADVRDCGSVVREIAAAGGTAMMGLPNRLHYVSAKGAIHAMTRSLRARVMGPRALQVHLYPQDVSSGVVFLASAESDKMTGQPMILDPGSVHG